MVAVDLCNGQILYATNAQKFFRATHKLSQNCIMLGNSSSCIFSEKSFCAPQVWQNLLAGAIRTFLVMIDYTRSLDLTTLNFYGIGPSYYLRSISASYIQENAKTSLRSVLKTTIYRQDSIPSGYPLW